VSRHSKTSLSARHVALSALREWRTGKEFADSILASLLLKTSLPARDRAFAQELFYGVLRNLTLLDFWIASVRRARLDVDLRDILRLGFYQVFLLETPAHAAVYETVELAAKKHRALINGILRGAMRNHEQLQQSANKQPSHVQFSHPQFLLRRWRNNFPGKAVVDLCLWNNRPPPVYARINQLKISLAEFLSIYPGSFLLPNLKNFVGLPGHISEAIAAGHCYVQDPSTAIACQLLDPQPGEKILDACSAPGGKTSYLAELMQNRGVIVACDRDQQRISLVEENLARLGVKIARVVQHDWTTSRIPREISSLAPFDRILVDAPCSNTGVMRRRLDVRWRLREADFLRMQKQQLKIIDAVVDLLKPGGVLVYSTCSIEPEENEQVLEEIANGKSILRLEAQKQLLPFREHFDGAFAARFVKIS
jgi:16S rRNA (cytosine967-C5)-methyltransferase